MADGYIRTPPDSTGKKVDATETTNGAGATVYRLRMDVPDGMKVSGSLLELIYSEMRTTNDLIAQAFGLANDLENLRNRPGDDNAN